MYPAGTELCGYCLNKIGTTHKFITCALCKSKIHIKCNNIERKSYDKMLNGKQVSMCIKCNTENLFIRVVKVVILNQLIRSH